MYGSLISSVTVGAGGAANISFTGIVGTFTDLICVVSLRSGGANTLVTFNGDTGANYTYKYLRGTGSAASSNGFSGNANLQQVQSTSSGDTASTFSNGLIYIPNYSGSNAKSVSFDAVTENNAAAAFQQIESGLWSGTAAITTITITPSSGTFDQYSTAYLYGLTKGSGGATVS